MVLLKPHVVLKAAFVVVDDLSMLVYVHHQHAPPFLYENHTSNHFISLHMLMSCFNCYFKLW